MRPGEMTPGQPRDPHERGDAEHHGQPAPLPAETGQQGPGGLTSQEGMAAAMQMQVEILRKMNERQQWLEEAVTDTQRAETMLTSTRALNESFRGMRRVQEKLLDELNEARDGRGRGLPLLLGLVVVAASIVWGVTGLKDTVEETGGRLSSARSDESLDSKLTELKTQLLSGIQENRQAQKRADLETRMESLTSSISELRQDRDQALQREKKAVSERDSMKSAMSEWQDRTDTAESTARRLTEENLSNQAMIRELSDALEKLRPGETRPDVAAVADGPGEDATPRTELPVASHEQVADGSPLPPASVKTINDLLADHRSSEAYSLTKIGTASGRVLQDVVLEIRSADGLVSRVVTARELSFDVAPRGDFLEMIFARGTVAYHQGPGKVISSPFFRNVYKVGVFGVNRTKWLAAGFAFVRVN